MTLNNTEHLLIITSKITECVSISAFASLVLQQQQKFVL